MRRQSDDHQVRPVREDDPKPPRVSVEAIGAQPAQARLAYRYVTGRHQQDAAVARFPAPIIMAGSSVRTLSRTQDLECLSSEAPRTCTQLGHDNLGKIQG
jgi:hypothetical protein